MGWWGSLGFVWFWAKGVLGWSQNGGLARSGFSSPWPDFFLFFFDGKITLRLQWIRNADANRHQKRRLYYLGIEKQTNCQKKQYLGWPPKQRLCFMSLARTSSHLLHFRWLFAFLRHPPKFGFYLHFRSTPRWVLLFSLRLLQNS